MEREKMVGIVVAAQNGDQAALNELFNAFYNDVYYFALKTVKDEQLACDITQEAFIEIINTLGNLKEPAAFVTWMKQITYHQCTRYFKKKKDVIVDEDEDGNTVFDTLKEENAEFIPDEALDQDDFKKTILAMLDELSEEQRSATMMYYFDEMSVRQIAEIQGVSEGTVKSRLNYARKSIKASVEEYEKKNSIKLHAIPFFPFIHWLFAGGAEGAMPFASAKLVASGVASATGSAVTATASAVGTAAGAAAITATTATATSTTVAATTTATAVGIGAKIAALPIVTKVVAGIVAATIVVGTGTTAVVLSQKNQENEDRNNKQSSYSSEIVQKPTNSKPVVTDELILEGTIPEGCTYTVYDGTVLTAGERFPETCTAGDVVAYGDYLYGYECVYAKNFDGIDEWYLWKDGFDDGDSGLTENDAFGSWSVMVADQTKTSYGIIVSKINGKPIKTLYATFYGCANMTEAPKIPSTITAMTATYYNCTSLLTAPVIPSNVERIMLSFYGCIALTGDVEINATLDKSLEWYYSDVFSNTRNRINLIGKTPEKDLILIAQNSDNRNITVNGKSTTKYQQVQTGLAKDKYLLLTDIDTATASFMNAIEFLPPSFYSNYSELTIDNATIFLFSFLMRNYSYNCETVDEQWERYYIPLSDVEEYAKRIFDIEYDFKTLNRTLLEGEDSMSMVTLQVSYDAEQDLMVFTREKYAIHVDNAFLLTQKQESAEGNYVFTIAYGSLYDELDKDDTQYKWYKTSDGMYLKAYGTIIMNVDSRKTGNFVITSFKRGEFF